MRAIVSVQVLRAVSAGAVVVAHAQGWLAAQTGALDALPDLHFVGVFAVDLFFVISGFIMVYTSEPMFGRPEGVKTFVVHRLLRIVPFYWLVTAFYIATSLAFPAFDRSYGPDFIAASFFFFPMQNTDGAVMPIVGHGWTLNYEMMFYAVFALAVFAPRRVAVASASAALVAVIILGKLLVPTSTALAFWTNPFVMQFVFGMLVGLLYREGVRLAKPLALGLAVIGCVSIYLFRHSQAGVAPQQLLAGLSATLVLAAATFGGFSLEGAFWRALATIGDASYAIYLLHSAPIRGALFLSRVTPLGFANAPWLYLAAALFGALALGVVTYFVFERPLMRFLRGLVNPRKRPQISGAQLQVEAAPSQPPRTGANERTA